MKEINNRAILLKITPDEEESAKLLFFIENGNIINLRAKSFFKPESKNRLSLGNVSILEIEYFQSENFIHTGKLKRITNLLEININSTNNNYKIEFLKNLIINYQKLSGEVYQSYEYLYKNIGKGITKCFYVYILDKPNICIWKYKIIYE